MLTLARDRRLRCHSHIDERCAGFFAVGLAKASGLPVAVTCTSGTALAELLPAAVEAHEARVPLLILSADRPPELRESGAGQTIDQIKLLGGAAKWFFEVGTHELADLDSSSAARLRWMRTLACRAYWRALDGRPGVVHLNFPLREPLVTDTDELPEDLTGRPDGAPYARHVSSAGRDRTAIDELGALIRGAQRGVLVAGRHERRTSLGEAAARFCAAAGWPLLADPLSGARRGSAAIAHYDALLRDAGFAASQRPDLVLRVGDLPTSKPLREWLAGLKPGTPQIQLDPEGAWQDPAGVLTHSFAVEPAAALTEIVTRPGDGDWLATWRGADERVAAATLGTLAAGGLSEPVVAAELGVLLPPEATLFVASSMPVRDIETFWPIRPDPPRVLCNRGANGIDGTVSSAFGVAAWEHPATAAAPTEHAVTADAEPGSTGGGPVVLLIGDVALAHDIGGLLAARRLDLPLTIVLLDNAGGGIFDFLPISAAPLARAAAPGEDPGEQDIFTRHIATPTGLDFADAARLYGLGHERVDDVVAFRGALERALSAQPPRASIVEVRGKRDRNVALHRRLWTSVAAALDAG